MACAASWLQIDSYTFQFPDDGGVQQRVFLPLLALLNHNGDPNTAVTEDKGSDSFVATALRDIRWGPCHIRWGPCHDQRWQV